MYTTEPTQCVWAIKRKPKSKYEHLRLLVLLMNRDWRDKGSTKKWTSLNEVIAQRHACVFREVIQYTEHPDPKIKKPRCPAHI